jgi:hypothetical protein
MDVIFRESIRDGFVKIVHKQSGIYLPAVRKSQLQE